MLTDAVNSLVSEFLIGATDGLSGRSAKIIDDEVLLTTPDSARSVNTLTTNLNRLPTLALGNSVTVKLVM